MESPIPHKDAASTVLILAVPSSSSMQLISFFV